MPGALSDRVQFTQAQRESQNDLIFWGERLSQFFRIIVKKKNKIGFNSSIKLDIPQLPKQAIYIKGLGLM